MTRRRSDPWTRLAWDGWTLGLETASVVGLRAAKIAAGGPAAKRESRRMVSEKVAAAQAWQVLAATGGLGVTLPGAASKTLRHYRRKVRANRRRLLKK